MVSQNEKLLLAGGAVALVLYFLSKQTTTTVTIPQPTGVATLPSTDASPGDVSPTQNSEVQATETLCQDAPLNSFGSACEGITWTRDTNGNPVDLRVASGSDASTTIDVDILPPNAGTFA